MTEATEMTERERAVQEAWTQEAGRIERRCKRGVIMPQVANFIAMHDALTAYDAAQKPAEPSAPSDPAATVREIADALRNIIKVVNSAGALNLSRGVQLGPTVWYVKMTAALEQGDRALASLETDNG